MRLIDADVLIEKLVHFEQSSSALKGIGLEPLMAIRTAGEMVQAMPAVDAAPVRHGRWVSIDEDSRGFFEECECSCCGRTTYLQFYVKVVDYEYCPNCGAKMNGGEQE